MKFNIDASGTSYHGVNINTTPQKLIDILGEPDYFTNDGSDKTNMDYSLETDNGVKFTIYDWKEYQSLNLNDTYEFHIGGNNMSDCNTAVRELRRMGV